MPQAISAFLIAAAGVTATSVAGVLITAAVTIGFTVGVNALVNAIFGPNRPKPSDGQQVISTAVGSRRRHYGIVCTGGQSSFRESRNGVFGEVVTLGTGREGDILEHKINGKVVNVVGGTITDASFHGAVHIYTRSGTDDQTAIGELTAKFPEWTVDHRQLGCAHAAIIGDPVKQTLFSEVYNGQRPEYSQTRKTAFLYDPRLDSTMIIGADAAGDPIYGAGACRLDDETTWPWSDNAALVIADYFAHPDGWGGGYENVNWANIAREADFCEIKVMAVSGEEIDRWRIWASYSLATEERQQVMAGMLMACDGFIWQDADAKFNLMTGRWEEPTVTITDDHILAMTATLGPKARQRVDAVKTFYTEAAVGYREQESATVAKPGAQGEPQAIQAFFAPHHNQAWRIGSLNLERLGDRWHISGELNLFGLNLIGEAFCRLNSAQLGVDAYFKVSGLKLDMIGCTIQAQFDEVKPEDWTPPPEGVPPIAPDLDTAPVTVAEPTGLALSAVQIALGETNGVAIAVTWDAGRPDLNYRAQYRPTGGGDWVPMQVDNDARTARSGPVDSGTEYEVELWAVTLGYRESTHVSATITPVATNALAAPSDLDASDGVGESVISLRLPTQASFAVARVYGSSTNDFGTAIQIGADITGALGDTKTVTDSGLSAGTRYYWARAFKAGGEASPVAGPVSATIS